MGFDLYDLLKRLHCHDLHTQHFIYKYRHVFKKSTTQTFFEYSENKTLLLCIRAIQNAPTILILIIKVFIYFSKYQTPMFVGLVHVHTRLTRSCYRY